MKRRLMLSALIGLAAVLSFVVPASLERTYAPFTDSETISGNVTAGFWSGSIKIIKNTVPNDGTDFTFTPSADLPATINTTPFLLEDDGNEGTNPSTKTFSDLDAPGTYHFVETAVSGYTLSSISCTVVINGPGTTTITYTGFNADPGFQAGDTTANVTLGAGDSVECTFQNDLTGATITIIKDVKTAAGGETDTDDFAFTTSGTSLSDFSLDDDGSNVSNPPTQLSNSKSFPIPTPTGTRSVTETAVAGWTITNISCIKSGGSGTATFAYNGATTNTNAFESGDNSVTITNLSANETVTCTFENTEVPPECFGNDFTQPNPVRVFVTPGVPFVQTNQDQIIVGTSGNDYIEGGNAKDCIIGNGGDDVLRGGNGSDGITGDGGNDYIFGDNSPDLMNGGAGTDACEDFGSVSATNCESDATVAPADLDVVVQGQGTGEDLSIAGGTANQFTAKIVYRLSNISISSAESNGPVTVTFTGTFGGTATRTSATASVSGTGGITCTAGNVTTAGWTCSGILDDDTPDTDEFNDITFSVVGTSSGSVTYTTNSSPTCTALTCTDGVITPANYDGSDLTPAPQSDTITP